MPAPMNPTRKRRLLRETMRVHDLTLAEVASLTRSSEFAVRAWLKNPDNRSARVIPDGLLELLLIKSERGDAHDSGWPLSRVNAA